MPGAMVNSETTPSQDPVHRARRLEPWWILGNLAYSGLRIILARQLLGQRGLNIWAFAAVEVLAAVPWAIGTSRITKGLLARRTDGLWTWFTIAGASFFAPDVFVVTTTHDVPTWIYVAIAVWVSVSATLATRRIVVSVRERRAAGA